mgnify:CR=1 FL=1
MSKKKNNSIGFIPKGNWVLTTKYKKEEKEDFVNVGNLFIPSQEDEDLLFKQHTGEVLMHGTTVSSDVTENIPVGTRINFSSMKEFKYKGEEYYLVNENDILVILED